MLDHDIAATRPSFLVCPPHRYDTHFLFEPHMSWTQRVDRRRAAAQWRRLVRVLEQAGATSSASKPRLRRERAGVRRRRVLLPRG